MKNEKKMKMIGKRHIPTTLVQTVVDQCDRTQNSLFDSAILTNFEIYSV